MDDVQAIRETISKWLSAAKEGHSDALAGMLDEEVLFVVLSQPPFGKNEFLVRNAGKPYRFDSAVDVREIVVNGDWALSRVHLSIEVKTTKGGKTARFAGPTMSVWRRSATGSWLIWRDANLVVPVE